MTLAQSARPTMTIAGFPLSAWVFALRTWAAMMVALYAAFWLQLESPSIAALTVGILALQTRGQAYQKAVYRIVATDHRRCRVICDRWVVPADSRTVHGRLRGLARALRLRRWTFGRQQGLRRRAVPVLRLLWLL